MKKVFDKYDEDGSGQMEKDEFDCMMNDLICVSNLVEKFDIEPLSDFSAK